MSEVTRETQEFPALDMKELDSLVVRVIHGVFTEETVCGVGLWQPLEGMQGREALVQEVTGAQCRLRAWGSVFWDIVSVTPVFSGLGY